MKSYRETKIKLYLESDCGTINIAFVEYKELIMEKDQYGRCTDTRTKT